MPTSHRNLTGADLHETKGADTAAVDTVLTATGSGTSLFKKIDDVNINQASVKNVNVDKLLFLLGTTNAAFDFYIPIEAAKTLTRVDTIINNTVGGANLVIEVVKNATPILTITYPTAGTVAGSKTTAVLSPGESFSTSDLFRIRSTATGVTSAGAVTVLLTFKVT